MEDKTVSNQENIKKAKEISLKVSNMNGKERFEYYKRQAEAKKQKLKLLIALKKDINNQLMTLEEVDEDKQVQLLQNLTDIGNQIVAIKRNKNNSHFYEWNPNMVMNRRQRRSK